MSDLPNHTASNFHFQSFGSISSFEFRTSDLFGNDVAIFTRPSGKGSMQYAFEELWVFRSMRIMAVSAIHHRRFDPDMCSAKGRSLRVVALPAQRLDGLVQQGSLK
jgi:hypothetical protein